MEPQSSKSERLEQIRHLLLRHKDGLTVSEIARHLGVNRSTVWHYYYDADLPHTHYEMGDDRRIRLNPDRLNFSIQLNLDEVMALHLAVRMFTTRMDRHDPSAATAMRKIAHAIEVMAPALSRAISQSADRADGDDQVRDPQYTETLETLTRAWAGGRQVRLEYASERGEIHTYQFCPYFIEPYAIGQTTYVIGALSGGEAFRTFKIQRIQAIALLDEPYTIPASFDPDGYLEFAWGIWSGSGVPQAVELRFNPTVARRVKETRWHRKQTIEELPDGALLWRSLIAEPREMLPWILGWGKEVEVLAPPSLQKMVEERL